MTRGAGPPGARQPDKPGTPLRVELAPPPTERCSSAWRPAACATGPARRRRRVGDTEPIVLGHEDAASSRKSAPADLASRGASCQLVRALSSASPASAAGSGSARSQALNRLPYGTTRPRRDGGATLPARHRDVRRGTVPRSPPCRSYDRPAVASLIGCCVSTGGRGRRRLRSGPERPSTGWRRGAVDRDGRKLAGAETIVAVDRSAAVGARTAGRDRERRARRRRRDSGSVVDDGGAGRLRGHRPPADGRPLFIRSVRIGGPPCWWG